MKQGPKRPKAYNRRNLLHCKSVGALASASAALVVLEGQSRPPQWLVRCLKGIQERLKPVADEMARHRDEAW